MKKILLFSLLLIFPSLVKSEQISEEQASAVAVRFFNGVHFDNAPRKLPLKSLKGNSPKGEAPAFYVFNRGINQGFVIVSGETSTHPILAYSNEGAFDMDNLPEGLSAWMSAVENVIRDIRTMNLAPSDRLHEEWDNFTMPLPSVKLETPLWDQDYPYNSKCPILGDYRFYTGCAITATAIVMGYHQWPDCGVGELKSFTSGEYDVFVPGITLGETYHWDKMPYINGNELDYNSYEQEDAVSTIMQHLGVMSKASYNYGGTSASLSTMAVKLPKHMKYRKSIQYLRRQDFSDGVWVNMLKEELSAGRPVIYEGYTSPTYGHAFVLDGYDENGLFSVNWGWGGRSNGYYRITSFSPEDQGAGGSLGGYNLLQAGIFRVEPLKEGVTMEHLDKMRFVKTDYVRMGLRLEDESQAIEWEKPFTLTAGKIMNLGTDVFVGETRIVVTDLVGNIKEVLYTSPERYIDPGYGQYPLDELREHITVTLTHPIAEGDRIRFVYKSANTNKWEPITCDEPEGQWEILLTATSGVEEIVIPSENDGKVYDLNGRTVEELQQGSVYVRKGQKFIAR